MISQAPDYRKLAAYYHDEFEPKHLAHMSEPTRRNWRKAIRAFLRFTAPTVTIGELNQQTLEEFDDWLHSKGMHLQTVSQYGSAVRKVLHKADPTRFKTRAMAVIDFKVENSAEDGTLWHFFETIYIPSRLGGLKPSSIAKIKCTLRSLDRWAGRSVMVRDLSDELVTGFLNWFVGRRSNATLNNMRGDLVALWRAAWRKRLIKRLPRLEKLPTSKRVPECWSQEELRRLLQSCRDTTGWIGGIDAGLFWYGLVHFLYFTGLRIGAARQLRPEHFDLTGCVVRVPAEFQKQNADQVLFLHPETVRVLEQIIAVGGAGPVFNFPLSRRMLFLRFRQILRRAGLTEGRRDMFHRLRRTCATYLAIGKSVADASQQLGHSSLEVTKRYIDPAKYPASNVAALLPDPGPIMKAVPLQLPGAAYPLPPEIGAMLIKRQPTRHDLTTIVAFIESTGVRRVEVAEAFGVAYGTLANVLGGFLPLSDKLIGNVRRSFGLNFTVEGGAA